MLALLHLVALSAACGQSAPGDGGVAAARGLLTRLLPDHADSFRLEARAPSACKGKTAKCFGYASALPGPKVAVYGTSGVELAMGINHYLKYVGNVSVNWEQTGGNQLSLPPRLPAPPSAVHMIRALDRAALLRERLHLQLQLRVVLPRGLGARDRLDGPAGHQPPARLHRPGGRLPEAVQSVRHLQREPVRVRADNSKGPGGPTGPLDTPFQTPRGILSGLTKTR